jgi:hypothetical protein
VGNKAADRLLTNQPVKPERFSLGWCASVKVVHKQTVFRYNRNASWFLIFWQRETALLSSTHPSQQHPATTETSSVAQHDPNTTPPPHEETQEPQLSAPQSGWNAAEPVSPLISSGALHAHITSPKAVPLTEPLPTSRRALIRHYAPDLIGWLTVVVFFLLPWLLLCGISLWSLGSWRSAMIATPPPLLGWFGFELWFRFIGNDPQGSPPDFFVTVASLIGLFLSFILFSFLMPS